MLLVIAAGCGREQSNEYTYSGAGYYAKLIAFESVKTDRPQRSIAAVSAVFSNQADSIFWDSRNNLNSRFFIKPGNAGPESPLEHFVAGAAEGDSALLLVKTPLFYRSVFRCGVPFFSGADSVVKVNLKVTRLMDSSEFEALSEDLLEEEHAAIAAYFGGNGQLSAAASEEGYYWVSRPSTLRPIPHAPGTRLRVSYTGRFLDGRICDASAADFEFIYGTPGQLLEGLNNVTGRLNLGGNAKIILPSRLAFGESGSSDRMVPPFTPLLYEISLKSIE